MPCIELYRPKGKNGVIYGLKEAENAYFELDLLWNDPYFRDQNDYKEFFRAVRGLADSLVTEGPDLFNDEHYRHELENRIFAVPNRHTWPTPLHAYFIRYSMRTIIYVGGTIRTDNGPIQTHPVLGPKSRRWLDIASDLDLIVKDPVNNLIELPDGGFGNRATGELIERIELH